MRSRTVIVFGDNTAALDLIEQTLCASGHRVLATANAAEALEVGRIVRVDVLVSELVVGAAGLAKQLRSTHPNLRVVYMVGDEHPDASESDGVAYLRKPISLGELGETVNAALGA